MPDAATLVAVPLLLRQLIAGAKTQELKQRLINMAIQYQQFVVNEIARLKNLLRLFTASLSEAQAASPTSSSSSSSSSATLNASSFLGCTTESNTENNIESQLGYIGGLLRNGALFSRLEVRRAASSALVRFPGNKHLLYLQAKIQDSLGEIREAKKTLETLISLEEDETMLSGIKSYYQTIVDRLAQADELMHTRSASTASFTS